MWCLGTNKKQNLTDIKPVILIVYEKKITLKMGKTRWINKNNLVGLRS